MENGTVRERSRRKMMLFIDEMRRIFSNHNLPVAQVERFASGSQRMSRASKCKHREWIKYAACAFSNALCVEGDAFVWQHKKRNSR